MSTSLAPTVHWPRVLPWLRDTAAAWRSRLVAPRVAPEFLVRDFGALVGLSDRTLRDIGAPDRMIGREHGTPVWQFERARW